MTNVYLVLEWNGLKWCCNNSPHALVPTGPYSSRESAEVNIARYLAESDLATPDDVCIVEVEWPTAAPPGRYVAQLT